MNNKIIGGILLIIGTSIGAGMLALPVATAAGGFYHSLLLFVAIWAVTVLGAYFILEVNLWLPDNTNLISMARKTLGKTGEFITWVCFLLLLYSLLSAYTAGGTDLLHTLLLYANINTPHILDSIVFIVVLGGIVHHGIHTADFANRSLMSSKLIAYFLLVAFVIPRVDLTKLEGGESQALLSAVMVVLTSFGYSVIIPSLRSYFNSNVKQLRLTLFLGSIGSLLIYILWDFVVQGTVPTSGSGGLIEISHSGQAASLLTSALSREVNHILITNLAHIFSSICVATSFIGVSLALSDFLADGFRVEKIGWNKWLVSAITFVPPLVIIILYPKSFIRALEYAGLFVVILSLLLPCLMVWNGRYRQKIAGGYKVMGGKGIIVVEIAFSLLLLGYGIFLLFIQ